MTSCDQCKSTINDKAKVCPFCKNRIWKNYDPLMLMMTFGSGLIIVGIWIPIIGWLVMIPIGILMLGLGAVLFILRLIYRVFKIIIK